MISRNILIQVCRAERHNRQPTEQGASGGGGGGRQRLSFCVLPPVANSNRLFSSPHLLIVQTGFRSHMQSGDVQGCDGSVQEVGGSWNMSPEFMLDSFF